MMTDGFNFFAALPPAATDVRSFIKDLNSETFFNYLLHVRRGNIKLALPKFETGMRTASKMSWQQWAWK